jgi:hypothetical protein
VLTAIACLPMAVHSQPSSPLAVPAAPTDLVPQVNGSTVTLTWLPGEGSAPTGYVVEAALSANGPAIASLPAGEPILTVTAVPDGVYFVRVRGINAEGAGLPSTEVVVVVGSFCGAVPEPPTGLVSTTWLGVASFTWTPAATGCPPTHYLLRAGSAPGLFDLASLNVGPQTIFVTPAPPGTYHVRVHAVNALGVSAPSNEELVSVGPSCIVPGAPEAFTAQSGSYYASFSWLPPTSGGAPTSYRLEAGSAPTTSDIAVLPVNGLTYDTPAPPGNYHVRVRAQNACGPGPASSTVLLTIACIPPGTPGTPAPSVSGSTVNLSWAPASAATSYGVEVGTAAGAANVRAVTVSGPSVQLTGLAANTYFTRVRALNACGSSANSGEAIFSIAPTTGSRSCGGGTVPGSAPCGTPTARCNDGTWSCSQNRSGTCSHHRGVSCWVCPGPLC